MQGIRPCPYCGGEVEVIKLNKRKDEKKSMYRIECLHCRALVARGLGFPNETLKESSERIKQYKEYQDRILYPNGVPFRKEICETTNQCVACGAIIPEGRQVCFKCEKSN